MNDKKIITVTGATGPELKNFDDGLRTTKIKYRWNNDSAEY